MNSPAKSYGDQVAEPGPELGSSDSNWSLARGGVSLLTRLSLSCELPPFKLRDTFWFPLAFSEWEERLGALLHGAKHSLT